jgi:hypothetical protein
MCVEEAPDLLGGVQSGKRRNSAGTSHVGPGPLVPRPAAAARRRRPPPPPARRPGAPTCRPVRAGGTPIPVTDRRSQGASSRPPAPPRRGHPSCRPRCRPSSRRGQATESSHAGVSVRAPPMSGGRPRCT